MKNIKYLTLLKAILMMSCLPLFIIIGFKYPILIICCWLSAIALIFIAGIVVVYFALL